MPLQVGVKRETGPGERRVALVPDGVARLIQSGLAVLVERGAGAGAEFSDAAYESAGAIIVETLEATQPVPDVFVCVARPPDEQVNALAQHTTLVGVLQAASNPEFVQTLADRGVTAFSLERIPRIARAQSMDVLSSQSNLSGYRAALIGASMLRKLFPMMITAAGTVAPARVLVMGAGVAGLQAIATARRLGAVVQGYDIRAAAREQVESLGATFVAPQTTTGTETSGGYATELSQDAQAREREAVLQAVSIADVVITTALVPGRRAPILLTADMVRQMKPGSVVIDVAAEAGGNCELTQPGQTIVSEAVTIVGPLNLPSTVSVHASQLYSRNLTNFLELIVKDGQLSFNFEDPIVDECCVAHAGEVRNGLGINVTSHA
jgi:proton-translocating NAD(P)+ transhydrogenase subunit alpha